MPRVRLGLRLFARAARLSAWVAAATLVAACGAISGLDQLTFDGAGGAGGASSGSHQASTTGAGGAGGGGPHVEDCLNGKDDDDNGLVDCKDPACSAYECDTLPSGWLGPIAFYLGADDTVTCPADFPVREWVGGTSTPPVQPPITCSACSCDTAPCEALVVQTFSDSACTTGNGTTALQPSTCATSPTMPGVRIANPTTNNTNCNAGGGKVTSKPPPTFTDHAIGCAPRSVGKGCAGGVCAPKTTAPFGAAACVYQPGLIAACPAGYGTTTIVMTDFDDTRACNACNCSSHSHRCDIEVSFYSDASCMNETGSAGGDICFAPPGSASFVRVSESSPCHPMGGGQGGGVVATKPVTVCCP